MNNALNYFQKNTGNSIQNRKMVIPLFYDGLRSYLIFSHLVIKKIDSRYSVMLGFSQCKLHSFQLSRSICYKPVEC